MSPRTAAPWLSLAALLLSFAQAAAAQAPKARNDVREAKLGGEPIVVVNTMQNDVLDLAQLNGGSFAIIQAPVHGSASVQPGIDPSTAINSYIRYTLPAYATEDVVGYRVCYADGRCADGQLRMIVRAVLSSETPASTPSDAGHVEAVLEGRPEPTALRFTTSPLAAAQVHDITVVSDPTHWSEWDLGGAGTAVRIATHTAPDDGQPSRWTLLARTSELNLHLHVGLDDNGDGAADESERRCTAAGFGAVPPGLCEVTVDLPAGGTQAWWVLLHNRSSNTQTTSLEMAAVRHGPGDARFVATGPGHLPAGSPGVVRMIWDIPALAGQTMYSLLHVESGQGVSLGRTPARFLIASNEPPVARALVSGRELVVRLGAGEAHERLYVDVPPGATSLTVQSGSGSNFDLYVARHDTLTHPAVDAAPPRGAAVASATGASGDETLTLTPPQLVPGRWYVTPVNAGGVADSVSVLATLSAAAPPVRSGSYFNPDRSGHGMFIYPAGGGTVWTVLWYHYFEDGSPTWYYLEGAAPGANGVFTSPVYRSAWDGDSNFLVPVGEATLTPSGPDAFTWSYRVDGQSGSEPLVALGRDCPSVDGIERDASSTWFNPLTAGTGYSVQLFPNAGGPGYEYTAAFVYDGHGVPRYLAAELPSAGPATHTYALEQLTGFCPLCTRTGAPTRQDIGTFTRTYAGAALSRVAVDAIYAGGIPGAWTGDDQVQPLGGAGTVQGCDP